MTPLLLSLVNHALHGFFYFADGLISPSLDLEPVIICYDSNCFLDAAFRFVSGSRDGPIRLSAALGSNALRWSSEEWSKARGNATVRPDQSRTRLA
jgi:hypothetical protein